MVEQDHRPHKVAPTFGSLLMDPGTMWCPTEVTVGMHKGT